MKDPTEHTAGMSTSEGNTDPARSTSQDLPHTWQFVHRSRLAVQSAFQAMQEHHQRVHELYEALTQAIQFGQERDRIWRAYHAALEEHRHVVRRYQLALEEHYRRQGYVKAREAEE